MLIRLLVSFLISISLFLVTGAQASQLRVGVGVADITPKLCPATHYEAFGPMFDKSKDCFRWINLGGFNPFYPFYNNNRIAQGVHDPIWARALAIVGENGEMSLMITVDVPGLVWKHIDPVKRRIAALLPVKIENITIACTHLHSAPDAAGYWSTFVIGHGKPFTDMVRKQIYVAAREAIATLQPAKMKAATTTHYSCYNAKTLELKKDPDCRIPDSEFDYQNPNHDYDNWLTQLDMRDPMVRNTRIVAAQFVSPRSGKTIATFINWNNHPELLESKNMLVSSDYMHYLRTYVEKMLGGTAVYFIGTLGSQIGGLRDTPVPMWNENFERVYRKDVTDIHGNAVPEFAYNGIPKIRSTGYEIGWETVKALNAAEFETGVDVHVVSERVLNQVDNFVHESLTGSVWNFDVARPDRMFHDWGRCSSLRGCVPSVLSFIQIGSLSLLTAPGEIDPAYFLGRHASEHDYGGKFGVWKYPAIEGLESHMPGKHRAMLGQANNYLSYMVPLSDNVGWWNSDHPNHYEELVTIGKRFGDDVYHDLLDLLERAKNPECQASSRALSLSPLITE